jgi:hypothetical protein
MPNLEKRLNPFDQSLLVDWVNFWITIKRDQPIKHNQPVDTKNKSEPWKKRDRPCERCYVKLDNGLMLQSLVFQCTGIKLGNWR